METNADTKLTKFILTLRRECQDTFRKKLPNSVSKLILTNTKQNDRDPDICNIISKYNHLLYEERVENNSLLSLVEWNFRFSEGVMKIGTLSGTASQLFNENDKSCIINSLEILRLLEMAKLQLRYENTRFSVQRVYHIIFNTNTVSVPQYRIMKHLTLRGYRLLFTKKKRLLSKVGNESVNSTFKNEKQKNFKSFVPPTNNDSEYVCCNMVSPSPFKRECIEQLDIYRSPIKMWDLLPPVMEDGFIHYATNISKYKTSIGICSIRTIRTEIF